MNHNDMIARFRQCAMRDQPLRKAVLETLMAYAGLRIRAEMRDNAIREERWQTKTEIRDLKRKLESTEEKLADARVKMDGRNG